MHDVRQHQPIRKPGTVTAVEVIMALKGGLAFVTAGYLCLSAAFGMANSSMDGSGLMMVAGLAVAAPAAALYLTLAYTVGKGRDWARIAAIVVEAIVLVTAPFAIVGNSGYVVFVLALTIVGAIAVIGCATHRSAFLYCRMR